MGRELSRDGRAAAPAFIRHREDVQPGWASRWKTATVFGIGVRAPRALLVWQDPSVFCAPLGPLSMAAGEPRMPRKLSLLSALPATACRPGRNTVVFWSSAEPPAYMNGISTGLARRNTSEIRTEPADRPWKDIRFPRLGLDDIAHRAGSFKTASSLALTPKGDSHVQFTARSIS